MIRVVVLILTVSNYSNGQTVGEYKRKEPFDTMKECLDKGADAARYATEWHKKKLDIETITTNVRCKWVELEGDRI